MANREADLRIESDEILVTKSYPGVGDDVWINITVRNDGQVDGSTSIRVEVIEDGDDRRLIEIINVEVSASGNTSFEVKWVPEKQGTAWVVVSTPNGMNERTEPIQIESGESTFIVEGLDGASNTMLTGFGIIAFLMVGLLGYLIMSGKKPPRDEYNEEEYI